MIRLINLLNPFTKPKLMPQTVLMLSFPNMSLGQTHKGPRCDEQWWKVLASRVSVTLLDARAIGASVFGIVSWLKSTMSQRTFILTLNCCHHLRMLCCWLHATTTYLCTLPHPAGTISIVSNLDFHMAYWSVLTWSELKLASRCFQYVLLDRSWWYICMSMCIVVARINTISFQWVDVFLSNLLHAT